MPPARDDAFNRLLLLAPDLFPPLSATVRVEHGAATHAAGTVLQDHHLVVRLGRSQETLRTSLPDDAVPARFDEQAYAMVVADGLGADGGVASGLAIAALLQLTLRYGRWNVRVDSLIAPEIVERITHFYRQIDSALVNVNRRVGGAPLHTTLTAICSAGRDLFFAHVGHSRAYLYRDRKLMQLTRDHTHAIFRDQAGRMGRPALVDLTNVASDLQHLLTDALGAGTVDPQVDVEHITLEDGDVVLLCTNGLTDAVSDRDVTAILGTVRAVDDICTALVNRAVDARTEDDVTVIVTRYHVPA